MDIITVDQVLRKIEGINPTQDDVDLVKRIFLYFNRWIYEDVKEEFSSKDMQLLNQLQYKAQIADGACSWFLRESFLGLTNNFYDRDYMHKYTSDDVKKIKEASSILAISLALFPTEEIIVRPNEKYIRNCTQHSEKTPSMYLFDNQNSYHCYGCQAGSAPGEDISGINYLAHHHQVSYTRAMEIIADTCGIKLVPSFGETHRDEELSGRIIAAKEGDFLNTLKEKNISKTEINRERIKNSIDVRNHYFCKYGNEVGFFLQRRYGTFREVNGRFCNHANSFYVYIDHDSCLIGMQNTNGRDWEKTGHTEITKDGEYTVNCDMTDSISFDELSKRKKKGYTRSTRAVSTKREINELRGYAREYFRR